MSGSVNKVIILGNLGRDPEVRTFNDGGKVCNPPTSFKYFTAEMSRYAGQKGEKLKAIEGGGGRLAASVVKKFPTPSMPDAWEGQG
jgi:phytoene dehydrogenase-like protein